MSNLTQIHDQIDGVIVSDRVQVDVAFDATEELNTSPGVERRALVATKKFAVDATSVTLEDILGEALPAAATSVVVNNPSSVNLFIDIGTASAASGFILNQAMEIWGNKTALDGLELVSDGTCAGALFVYTG